LNPSTVVDRQVGCGRDPFQYGNVLQSSLSRTIEIDEMKAAQAGSFKTLCHFDRIDRVRVLRAKSPRFSRTHWPSIKSMAGMMSIIFVKVLQDPLPNVT
jgi:hypothetical protein